MKIITGDDVEIEIKLMVDGATFVIDEAAVIKVALVDKNNSKLLTTPVPISRLTEGSNWGSSLIVAKIPGRLTASIKTSMAAKIEVQIDAGGEKNSWISDITIVKGLIL